MAERLTDVDREEEEEGTVEAVSSGELEVEIETLAERLTDVDREEEEEICGLIVFVRDARGDREATMTDAVCELVMLVVGDDEVVPLGVDDEVSLFVSITDDDLVGLIEGVPLRVGLPVAVPERELV